MTIMLLCPIWLFSLPLRIGSLLIVCDWLLAGWILKKVNCFFGLFFFFCLIKATKLEAHTFISLNWLIQSLVTDSCFCSDAFLCQPTAFHCLASNCQLWMDCKQLFAPLQWVSIVELALLLHRSLWVSSFRFCSLTRLFTTDFLLKHYHCDSL